MMVKTSNKFRENAENCLLLAEGSTNAQATIRYRRMARAWSALATEQEWLDGDPPQTDRAIDPAQTERASELAGATLDGLSDKDTSTADVTSRKSRLIDGPVQFRNSRLDSD
jgi:hypothetical protein